MGGTTTSRSWACIAMSTVCFAVDDLNVWLSDGGRAAGGGRRAAGEGRRVGDRRHGRAAAGDERETALCYLGKRLQ